MENPVLLSLGKWPQQSFSRNFKTSPTTSRVISNVKIDIDSILPLSFAQFVLENNLMNNSKTQIQDLYQRQLQRRKKKVEILRGIWLKAKQKRSKSSKKSFSTKSSCLLTKRIDATKRSTSKSLHKQNNNKSKSPLFFKAKSPSKGSTYFDYYNTNNQTKVNKKTSYQQQSTQSRRQKTNASRNNQQYFNNSWHKKISQRQSTQPQQNLLNVMTTMMKKWTELDKKHFQELEQFNDLSERQRKRLLKIHQIQKQKLKKLIQNLKGKIGSHKKLTKGIVN